MGKPTGKENSTPFEKTKYNIYCNGTSNDEMIASAPIYEAPSPSAPQFKENPKPTKIHDKPLSKPPEQSCDSSTSKIVDPSSNSRWIVLYLLVTLCLILLVTVFGLLTSMVVNSGPNDQDLKLSAVLKNQERLHRDFIHRMPGATCIGLRGNYLYSSYEEKQTIYPPFLEKGLEVFCDDEDGGGWIIIQFRPDDSSNTFDRLWTEYVEGFGNLSDYWIGLKQLHALTEEADFEMRIDLEDWCGNAVYIEYSDFKVGGPDDGYKLEISGPSGTAANSLQSSNGKRFTVNDKQTTSYCQQRHGGWWYDNEGDGSYRCLNTNLNGQHFTRYEIYERYYTCYSYRCDSCRKDIDYSHGVYWAGFGSPGDIIKSTKMKIRLKL